MKWIRQNIFYILSFGVLSILVFSPVLKNIDSQIIGNLPVPGHVQAQDGIQNIWNFWWAKKTCIGFCGDIWHTDYQFTPVGTSLVFQTFSLPNLVLMFPAMLLGLSYVGAYNISLFIAVFLSMVSMFYLSKYVTKDTRAATLSAIIYGLSPYLIGHIIDGQLNLATIQFFPLFLLFLSKSSEEDSRVYALLTGLTLFIIGLNDYVYLIFALLIWAIYIFTRILTKKFGSGGTKLSLLTLTTFLITFLPYGYRAISTYSDYNLSGPTKWNADFSSANLAAYLTPPPNTLLGHILPDIYGRFTGIYSDKSLFIGFIVLALSLIAAIKYWKKLLFWVLLLFIPLVLSFGLRLMYFDKAISTWMPFSLLTHIPILNVLRAPSRFDALLVLSFSVLAGYGFVAIVGYMKGHTYKNFLFTALAVLLVLEFFPVFLNVKILDIPKGYQIIKDLPADTKIIEAPSLWVTGLENIGDFSIDSLYYQTYHEKRMSSGYVTRAKESDFRSYKDYPLLNLIVTARARSAVEKESRETLDKYEDIDATKLLKDNVYDYLIIKSSLDSYTKDRITNALKGHLKQYFADDQTEIYKIIP